MLSECWRKKNNNKNHDSDNKSSEIQLPPGAMRRTTIRPGTQTKLRITQRKEPQTSNRKAEAVNRGLTAIFYASVVHISHILTCLNSEASHVFIKDKSLFWKYRAISLHLVNTGDHRSQIVGQGKIKLSLGEGVLLPAKHRSSLDANLISPPTLRKYFDVRFERSFTIIDNPIGNMLYNAISRYGFYALPEPVH